jgi:hypothetical protein
MLPIGNLAFLDHGHLFHGQTLEGHRVYLQAHPGTGRHAQRPFRFTGSGQAALRYPPAI